MRPKVFRLIKYLFFVIVFLLLPACQSPTLPSAATIASFTVTPTGLSTHTPTSTATLTPTCTSMPIEPFPTVPAWSPFHPDSEKAWCWQEMVGLTNALNDVFFVDAQTGWAVGDKGTILHTRDGGKTWLRQISPINFSLVRVVFVNVNVGWITAKAQYGDWALVRTDDGGQTWERWPLPFNIKASISVLDIAWANEQTGWLIAADLVFRTADGGQTWTKQKLPVGGELLAVRCIDEQHAWISTWRSFFRTTDGGKTWTHHLHDLFTGYFVFLDAETGWMVNNSSECALAKTTDGGQTWQKQGSDQVHIWLDQIAFWDKNTGWGFSSGGRLWHTRDGGETWTEGHIPQNRLATTWVDAQHGWAVGTTDWFAGTGKRTSIAYTDDGGQTWQFQDQNIEASPLTFQSIGRLSPLLIRPDPPLEALLLQLLPSPCGIEEAEWMEVVLYNLGWNGTAWGNPPLKPKSLEAWSIQRLDVDLDQDGKDEIILYGGGESYELFAGVLDWDGRQWQTSWFERTGTFYSGNIRVNVQDMGEKPLLQVETLYHPYEGSGELGQNWESVWVQCEHLECRAIWRDALSTMNRFCHHCNHYDRSGVNYRLIDHVTLPTIERISYGVQIECENAGQAVNLLRVTFDPVEKMVFEWQGQEYRQTSSTILRPIYVQDTRPLTETINIGVDDIAVQFVYEWTADCIGLQKTLTAWRLSDDNRVLLKQSFMILATGDPEEGLFVRDVDGDGVVEIVECAHTFPDSIMLREEPWPSMQPVCTVYHWDVASQQFVP